MGAINKNPENRITRHLYDAVHFHGNQSIVYNAISSLFCLFAFFVQIYVLILTHKVCVIQLSSFINYSESAYVCSSFVISSQKLIQ